MGAAGSSNSAAFSSPTLRERDGEAFVFGTEKSCPERANENIRQRTRTSAFDVGEEPRSQGPSPCATFGGEEWWSQRPSTSSLSNLRAPPRDTLLTYAAQMTGWQTAEGHGPSFSQQHREAMELSKVISQLAMANQQLASAHTATLAHLEALYVELRKERESRGPEVCLGSLDEALRRRLATDWPRNADAEDELRRTEVRMSRLENPSTENRDACQSRQRFHRQEEERKLRSRTERLETVSQGPDRMDEPEGRWSSNCDPVQREMSAPVCNNRLPGDNHVPEHESMNPNSSEEERVTASRVSVKYDGGQSSTTDLHLDKSDEEIRDTANDEGEDWKEGSRIEVKRLMAEKSKCQSENEKLVKELAEQRSMMAKLAKDYKELEARQQETESRLQARTEESVKLKETIETAARETERLLRDIDAVRAQKTTADARISSLEDELQKLLSENERIKGIEGRKIAELKAQLSEAVSDKMKRIKALEDALDEIQRLKEIIKTDGKGDIRGGSEEDIVSDESIDDPQESPPTHSTDRATNIEEFKKELTLKREARQRAIAAVSSEMERLRRELDAEKEAHSETSRMLDVLRSAQKQASTEDENPRKADDREQKEHELAMQRVEAQRLMSILKVSDELRSNIRLQIDKVDDLRYQLETEPDVHRYRIRCLADLTNRTREAVYKRERRTSDVKDQLAEILENFRDKSFLQAKSDVAEECERQLENIDALKSLYNERLKMLSEVKEAAVKDLADARIRLDHTLTKCECLEEDLKKADEKIDVQDTEISNLESQLGLTKADCRDLQNQMSLINGLFTQMLLGATSADMDLDRLTQLLQENHDLICDMAREEGTEAAALPKLLLDLIEQVEGSKGSQKNVDGENSTEVEAPKKEDDLQQEDIAHNLPKVWRVLLELLSCHAEGTPSASAASSSDPNICYKSVDTPAGPRLVISVSKTYIRLKELILEKKHLEKEMNRMKQLNTHLESKLGEQEKRLSTVSAELSKTWTIVDRLQAQHQQLHTHEQILRYELQQKRKMLQELKQELEYCREKWESARQKNTNTEIEWRSLRREFAARKALAVHDSLNNSGESGFSDERGDDTDEEDNAVDGRIRLGPRRRPRKESPRVPSPDTESEQPTDTELSDPKTGSSATLEQRTPTPETEAELDETEITDSTLNTDSTNATETPQLSESSQESMNPLDRALTNVIQNLIGIDDSITSTSEPFTIISNEEVRNKAEREDSVSKDCQIMESSIESRRSSEEFKESKSEDVEDNRDEITLPIICDQNAVSLSNGDDSQSVSNVDTEKETSEGSVEAYVNDEARETSTIVTHSVFSIGPFPTTNAPPSIVKNVQFSDPLIVGPSNRFVAPVFGAPILDKQFVPSFASSANQDAELIEKCPSSSSETNEQETDSNEAAGSSKPEDKVIVGKSRTPEEALAAREDRLKRLEEQAKWLMNKMNATSRRGSALSNRLEELHEAYGEPPVPPPMPDVLPSRRLRTNLSEIPRQVPESSTSEDTGNTAQPVSDGDPKESPPNNGS